MQKSRHVKNWDEQIALLIFSHARQAPITPNLLKKTRQKHQPLSPKPFVQNGFELKARNTAKHGQLSKVIALEGSPGKTGLVRVKLV